jgi:hypothetical protein
MSRSRTDRRAKVVLSRLPILGDSMRTFLLLVIGMMVSLGCRDADRKAIEAKCDTSLRQRAETLARDHDEGPLEVLGRCEGPIDESRHKKLRSAGAELGQVTDDLFTARIRVSKLGDVASLGFVKSLQLSQTRELQGH